MRIEPGAIALDKAVALQPFQPLADRGRRQPDPLRQFDIGDAAIPLKNGEDFAVYLVDFHHLSGNLYDTQNFLRQNLTFVYRTTVGPAVSWRQPSESPCRSTHHRFRPSAAPYAPDDRRHRSPAARHARSSSAAQEARIDRTATRLIEAIRANDDPLGGVEDMLREFALSTKEGLALMVLAEALLRVPDARTADQFIEDKLGQGDFVHHETRSSAFLVNASAWALGMSARVIQPGETPQGTIGRLTKRLGAPAVRAATRQAMRLMGSHFVLGETIEAALERAQPHSARHQRYSFDMLGEGARTADDATRYFNSYASAIEAIGRAAG